MHRGFQITNLGSLFHPESAATVNAEGPRVNTCLAQGQVLSPPSRLDSIANLIHGLTPTATCCRRSAARLESPGRRPGGLSLNYPIVRRCCDLEESGVAASAGRLLGKLGEVPEKSRSAVKANYSLGGNRIDQAERELWRGCRLIHVGVTGRAVPVYDAGGTPALPGGFTPRGHTRRNVSAWAPVDPRGGDARGRAGLWCGRDARAPGGAIRPVVLSPRGRVRRR